MFQNKKILGVIPARGGSKGIPRKNLRLINGRPLIYWTIAAAKESNYIDMLIVSSEDQEIIATCKSFGCDAPFVRPAHLAQDASPGIDPVLHAIDQFPDFDYVVLLQPTSPLRSAADIDGALERCITSRASFCVSVSEASSHPYWTYKFGASQTLLPFLENVPLIKSRQDLPKCFALNGAVYVGECRAVKKHQSFLSNETLGFEMPGERSIDVDDETDLLLAEILLKQRS